MRAQKFCQEQEQEREQEQKQEQEQLRTTIGDFATFRFGTLPVSLTPNNGSASFAIGSRP